MAAGHVVTHIDAILDAELPYWFGWHRKIPVTIPGHQNKKKKTRNAGGDKKKKNKKKANQTGCSDNLE